MPLLPRPWTVVPKPDGYWNEVANLLGHARRNELQVAYESGLLYGDDLDREVQGARRAEEVRNPTPPLNINIASHMGPLHIDLTNNKDYFDKKGFVEGEELVILKSNHLYVFRKNGLQAWFDAGNKVIPGTAEPITQNDIQLFTFVEDLTLGGRRNRRRKSRRIGGVHGNANNVQAAHAHLLALLGNRARQPPQNPNNVRGARERFLALLGVPPVPRDNAEVFFTHNPTDPPLTTNEEIVPHRGSIKLNLKKQFPNGNALSLEEFVNGDQLIILEGNTNFVFKIDTLQDMFNSGHNKNPLTDKPITQKDIARFTYIEDLTKGGRHRKSRRKMNKKKTRRH